MFKQVPTPESATRLHAARSAIPVELLAATFTARIAAVCTASVAPIAFTAIVLSLYLKLLLLRCARRSTPCVFLRCKPLLWRWFEADVAIESLHRSYIFELRIAAHFLQK
jgi:hypothetical protein